MTMTKVFNSFSILFLILFFSSVGFAGGDDTSVLQEELDMVLMEELTHVLISLRVILMMIVISLQL